MRSEFELQQEELFRMSPVARRYLCIICPNCQQPKPVPVFRIVTRGITRWVCRRCLKDFPQD